MLLAYLMLNDTRICPISSKQLLAQILRSIEQQQLLFFFLFMASTRSALFTFFFFKGHFILQHYFYFCSFQSLYLPALGGVLVWNPASFCASHFLTVRALKFCSARTLTMYFKFLYCLKICQLRLNLSYSSSSFTVFPQWSFLLC